jgi:membrane protein implicated in regulation of membrane protease activity
MGINMETFWLILFVIFIVAELATAGALVSIWFCFGSLAAMAAAKADTPWLVQLVVFVVVSAALVILTKPFLRKILKFKIQPTNVDAIIGGTGVVLETISNIDEKGAVKIDGKIWTARSVADNAVIEKNSKIKVVEIRGVKLIVEMCEGGE